MVDKMKKTTDGDISSLEGCLDSFKQLDVPTEGLYCNGTWDKWLCWPPTEAGSIIKLQCPVIPGLVATNYASRKCGPMGLWEGKTEGDYSIPNGYSNYLECYTDEAREIYNKYFANKSPAQKQLLYDIVNSTRTLEICGLSLSMVSTFVSLLIFAYFRSLKCNRTRIHKNLFVAIFVQVLIELIQYIDQHIARSSGHQGDGRRIGTIYNTPVFCEILIALIEYTKTVKFMWMFIEGLYLHNLIAVSVFSGKPRYALYYSVGWGLPMLLTISWVIPMTQIKEEVKCWYGYHEMDMVWIIEAPRVAVMFVNLFFLLNIIRVLVMKLRETHTNEANRVRKAVKAAIVLLPLLGITNFVVMLDPHSDDLVKFGVWAFISHFLISFEGFFIALLYCFLNGEVQTALKRFVCHRRRHQQLHGMEFSWRKQVRAALSRFWQRFRTFRGPGLRRLSRSFSVFSSFTEVSHAPIQRNSQVRTSPICSVRTKKPPGTVTRFNAEYHPTRNDNPDINVSPDELVGNQVYSTVL